MSKRNEALARARRQEGLTQKQICDLLHINEKGYQRYERGVTIPNAQTAIRIAKALNSTVEELFG